jgi:agmatinase
MNIFGINSKQNDAAITLIPVPWEVTTSYGDGTADGPKIVERASHQVDLWDSVFKDVVEKSGVFMFTEDKAIRELNNKLKPKALDSVEEVNAASDKVNDLVYKKAKDNLAKNKIVGVVGGDHSSPIGLIKALTEKFGNDYAILHFDAHADLRKEYQGFNHSHASIMYNVMTAPFSPKKLVQVGIRDFCEEELTRIRKSEGKIKTFFDDDIKEKQFAGHSWEKICDSIIKELPKNIYISFDIDGLEAALCPGTGTPVPGGLTYSECNYLFKKILDAKKKVIGFDLCEVSGSEWDANVGARVLFKLCGLTLATVKHF